MKTHHLFYLLFLLIISCNNSNAWITMESKELGFSVDFPSTPEFTKQTSIVEYGKQDFSVYFYETDNKFDDNFRYFAAKTIYPDSLIEVYKNNIDDFFDSAIQRSIESVHGKKITYKVVNYMDYPGREVKIDFKNGEAVFTMRIYLIKNAAFILQTITQTEKDYNKSQSKFFNSFKLLDKV